ncbi:hypothetical protein OF83DRAFT_1173221 [Amylostereum chailletii]|nr:hypothetical protein OF83DRAFT_1173221 [Amylostereum chailletii]
MTSIGSIPTISPLPTSGPGIGLPLFGFFDPKEMFTCGASLISWTYEGSGDALTIAITNVGVEQDAPLSSTISPSATSTSASLTRTSTSSSTLPVGPGGNPPAKKRQFGGYGGTYLPTITETLAQGLDPHAENWTWPSVNVTQGWYKLIATIPDTTITAQNSLPFFVANGSTVDCLQSASPTSALPSSAGSSATSSPSASSILAPVNEASRSSHAGAIAGGVVGGIAFLGAVIGALIFWFCRHRRPAARRSRAIAVEGAGSGFGPSTWGALGAKRARHVSDSVQALPKHAHSQTSSIAAREALQSPVGSDEELSSTAHEKVVVDGSNAAACNNGMEGFVPYTPTPRATKRASASSSISPPPYTFNNRSRGASQCALSQPELPRSTSTNTNTSSTTAPSADGQGAAPARRMSLALAPPSLRIGETEHIPMERTPVTPARRKPVPRYDSSDFAMPDVPQSPSLYGGQESARASRATLDSFHALQHQGSYGNMRPMHVMMPDPPAAQD